MKKIALIVAVCALTGCAGKTHEKNFQLGEFVCSESKREIVIKKETVDFLKNLQVLNSDFPSPLYESEEELGNLIERLLEACDEFLSKSRTDAPESEE